MLGLPHSASQDDVKARWRILCKQHHPDLQPPHLRPQAEQHFKLVSTAYRQLASRNLAAYADFNAAAAGGARGSPYGTGFRSPWAPGGGVPATKFSNGVVAGVLLVPLVIT